MLDYGEDSIGFGKEGEGNLHKFEDARKTAIVEFRLFELEIRR